jgi:hypothetical protein
MLILAATALNAASSALSRGPLLNEGILSALQRVGRRSALNECTHGVQCCRKLRLEVRACIFEQKQQQGLLGALGQKWDLGSPILNVERSCTGRDEHKPLSQRAIWSAAQQLLQRANTTLQASKEMKYTAFVLGLASCIVLPCRATAHGPQRWLKAM